MRERKRNRLQGYDYSRNGYYFITICTQDRIDWFGEIRNGEMKLNKNGEIIRQCWDDLPNHYHNVDLDVFVVMPNHVHGIVVVDNVSVGDGCGVVGVGFGDGKVGVGLKPTPTGITATTHGLSEIIRGFKTFSSRRINENLNNTQKFKWQRSFYDHVIRDDLSLYRIREYIINNPRKWERDRNNQDGLDLGANVFKNNMMQCVTR
ncbi:MAG TPA: transposase [Patescibacteria group bacterium]|nr:transposase [Patescibacteria group bacterium]